MLEGVIFLRVQIQGGSTYENVNISNDYRISDIFRAGGKFSMWRRNSLGGVKIHHSGHKRDSKMCRI